MHTEFLVRAALAVSGIGIPGQQWRPLLACQHLWPTRTDGQLVVGSTLFGIGWGLVELCPGPALVTVAGLLPSVIVFVLAMRPG